MFNSHLVDPHPLPTHPRFAGAVVNNERVGPGGPFFIPYRRGQWFKSRIAYNADFFLLDSCYNLRCV